MWVKTLLTLAFSIYGVAALAQRPVIFDTDMGPDYDDVGAITLLHAFADSGQVKILATVASTNYEGVAGVLEVFNTYFRRPHLPIGVPHRNGLLLRDNQHWTDTLLARYPHTLQHNAGVPDAVTVYRKVLATQPDHSVTIISVGFFTNLANLLQSPPDQYSHLNGTQLVQRKVKQLVSMAGQFPAGKEFNVAMDTASSAYVFAHWPTRLLFSGYEIGEKIKTGLPLIQDTHITHSPVKDVFNLSIPLAAEDREGRMSWDESTVLVGCKDPLTYYTLQPGHIVLHADGSNSWDTSGKQQAYLVEKTSPATVQAYINQLMKHQPKHHK
ncbi:nucleoside hydrolase [Chitinophaga costaii]|nr:nucleoside hydrolase [Chitinophaga costaii]PUZ24404.1 nucleoside hydrolase [Chitinophaga costaii]